MAQVQRAKTVQITLEPGDATRYEFLVTRSRGRVLVVSPQFGVMVQFDDFEVWGYGEDLVDPAKLHATAHTLRGAAEVQSINPYTFRAMAEAAYRYMADHHGEVA